MMTRGARPVVGAGSQAGREILPARTRRAPSRREHAGSHREGMTTTTAPARQGASHMRAGTIGLALLIPVGPLAVAVLRGILPYRTTDSMTAMAGKVAAHQGAEQAVLWLSMAAAFALVPGTIAIGALAVRGARRLGTAATILAVAGFSSLPGIVAPDQAALAGTEAGLSPAAVGHLLDQVNDQPTIALAGVVFVLGHVLGVLLLGIALWRAGAIPAWAGLVLAVSQPLHAVFAVGIPNHALDACAWGLTALGYAVAARALLLERTSR